MTAIKKFTMFALCGTLLSTPSYAAVNFILKRNQQANYSEGNQTEVNEQKACKEKGFAVKVSSCGNKIPGLLCPMSPNYTDECCDARYSQVINSACHNNTIPSPDTCGGRFRCYCSPTVYPKGIDRERCSGKFIYDTSNKCTETYTGSDGITVQTEYYTGCMCSDSYAICNSSYRLHGVGDACSYNGNVYYSGCSCDAGYNKLCLSSGAKNPGDYCLFNNKRYYMECNSDEAPDLNGTEVESPVN